jgi:hypothetical protein
MRCVQRVFPSTVCLLLRKSCLVTNSSIRDALLRHSSVHSERAVEVKQQLASQATRAAKACKSCANSKQQCRGGIPCARCTKKNTVCLIGPSNSHVNDVRLGEEEQAGSSLDNTRSVRNVLTGRESHHYEPDIGLPPQDTSSLGRGDCDEDFPLESYLPSPNISAPNWYQNHQFTESNGAVHSDLALNGSSMFS